MKDYAMGRIMMKQNAIIIIMLLLGVAILAITVGSGYRLVIGIETLINDEEADSPPGPYIPVGDKIVWTYEVKNVGDTPLSNILVTDNAPGVDPIYRSGDINRNGLLEPGEIWIYEARGVAEEGQHENIGHARGTESVMNNSVGYDDPSNYFGVLPGRT